MLDKADQELMDSLKNKYQDGGPTDTLEQQDAGVNKSAAAAWPAAAAMDSLAHVHVCSVCQGSGVQTGVYEFRRMESTCKHCQGEGVLVTGGKSSNCQNSKSNMDTHSAPVESAQTVPEHAAVATAEAKSRRHAERQCAKLQQKIEEVTQEKASMIAALTEESGTAGSSSSSMQRTLQENLVEQLQVFLDSLKAAHSAAMQVLECRTGSWA